MTRTARPSLRKKALSRGVAELLQNFRFDGERLGIALDRKRY